MRRSVVRAVVVLAIVGAVTPIQGSIAVAGHVAIPPLDASKIDYTPIGYYGPADEAGTPAGESATIPSPGPVPLVGPNPSGKWVAYDTNVWESLALPSRHPGDNCNTLTPEEQAERNCQKGDLDADDDGPGGYAGPNGTSTTHGVCPPSFNPLFAAWGECFNSQLEYLDYFERSMKEMLGDFGVVVHRYPFHSPGTGTRGAPFDAGGGQAYNISATIPGADHPEETVLVSGHYDFTDSGPAAAWDSAEGHTEVMRMAYIMSDYWRKTGTRPSATIKFIPWDSEESGTHGSRHYVRNNIPPGEEDEVRGYFNVDPCAGAYPAFKEGTAFTTQVPEVMQLANPANAETEAIAARMRAFNVKAEIVVDEVFDYLDDTITTPAGELPIFVSDAEAEGDGPGGVQSQRDMIVTAVGGLLLFTSDYANFEGAGIPIFNLFPDYFGPHADLTPASAEGISVLHTPRDNLTTVNRLTSGLGPANVPDPTGTFASEGWAKGMEMCAQIESWYMLQPEMAGARTATNEVVAYFEALPNEAVQNEPVTFDASGSHQYSDAAARTLVDPDSFTYTWDFGDGTTGTGKVVRHQYAEIGRYDATLTVTGSGGSDTMTIPVTVIGSPFTPPELHPISPEDAADGAFSLSWDFAGTRDGFTHYSVEESTNYVRPIDDDAEGSLETLWVASPSPGGSAQPWQRSDSLTVKTLGNRRHSGAASYWTGASPSTAPAGTNRETTLTLKEPVTVPTKGSVNLSYYSLFAMELDDLGQVEIAIDDGDPATHHHWSVVDQIADTFCADEPDTLLEELEKRSVDLTPYQGKTILLRFRWILGDSEGNRCQPAGWYVDDIRLEAGQFDPIGTTTKTSFAVTGKRNGSYAYRVLAVYSDGVSSAPSNVERARVTEAKPDLRVTAMSASNNKAREGEKVTISATVTNSGAEDAAASQTEFLLDRSTVLGVVDTPPIPGGESRTVSVQWSTRGVKGEHEVKATADIGGNVDEPNETNNAATLTVVVQGNKVKNGSFEQANESGSGPANWSAQDTQAGTTSWSDGGSDGAKSTSASGNGGNATLAGSPSWTSDPISVTGGETVSLAVSVAATDVSSPASAGLAYLGPAGQVLDRVTLITAPFTTFGFGKLEQTVEIPAGVTHVRVVLTGFSSIDTSTGGTVTFDEVGLFAN